jgi:mRNA interferase RelE/StbE
VSPRYRVQIERRAQKALNALPRDLRRRVAAKVDALAENPRPLGVRKLEGEEDLYRLRVGDYRVLYAIRDAVLLVLVVRTADRREVYR